MRGIESIEEAKRLLINLYSTKSIQFTGLIIPCIIAFFTYMPVAFQLYRVLDDYFCIGFIDFINFSVESALAFLILFLLGRLYYYNKIISIILRPKLLSKVRRMSPERIVVASMIEREALSLLEESFSRKLMEAKRINFEAVKYWFLYNYVLPRIRRPRRWLQLYIISVIIVFLAWEAWKQIGFITIMFFVTIILLFLILSSTYLYLKASIRRTIKEIRRRIREEAER